MDDLDVTVFVCISCTGEGATTDKPGRSLFDAVTARLDDRTDCRIAIRPVDCLAVCKRPCTVALAANGKWTYVVGDLDHETHADDIVAAALSFGATANGIIPWRERPQSFRKGVVARIPPLGFRPEDQGL